MDQQNQKARQLWVALLTTVLMIPTGITMFLTFQPWSVLLMILISAGAVMQWVIYLMYCERIENEKFKSRLSGVARNV